MMDGSLIFNSKMCLPPQHLMPYQPHLLQSLLPHHEASIICRSSTSSSSSSRSSRCSAQSSPENKSEDDCPIGYGAFGVVWLVSLFSNFSQLSNDFKCRLFFHQQPQPLLFSSLHTFLLKNTLFHPQITFPSSLSQGSDRSSIKQKSGIEKDFQHLPEPRVMQASLQGTYLPHRTSP